MKPREPIAASGRSEPVLLAVGAAPVQLEVNTLVHSDRGKDWNVGHYYSEIASIHTGRPYRRQIFQCEGETFPRVEGANMPSVNVYTTVKCLIALHGNVTGEHHFYYSEAALYPVYRQFALIGDGHVFGSELVRII
jgi:hypothetical protein